MPIEHEINDYKSEILSLIEFSCSFELPLPLGISLTVNDTPVALDSLIN